MTKQVVIYVPSYNEEHTLEKLVQTIRQKYGNPDGYQVKIIIVNDGSKDGTGRIAESLKARGLVDHVVHHVKNMGLGAATRSGLWKAYEMGADIAVKIDADFQHDPEDIEKVIRPILEDKTDVCFGSRFLGTINYRMPFYRKMGNAFFSMLTEFFTGLKVTDGQTGLIATNRRYLERFRLTSDYNETQQMIIDAWRNQLRFLEVPVVFHKREHGRSFISLKYPFKVIPNIIRLFIHSCPLKIFLPLGVVLIAVSMVFGYMFWIGKPGIFGDVAAIILFLSGVQIVLFGFIADIISKKRTF
jgi:glycosyltransferase involved in cell wall biosynthesis